MTRQDWLLFICTAVGFVLIFPPFPLGLTAFFVLIPFFYLIQRKNLTETFRLGYGLGLVWFCGTAYWIGWPTLAGLIAAFLTFPLVPALYFWIHGLIVRRFGRKAWILFPFVWTGFEILLEWSGIGFHWFSLAHTQTYTPLLIQFIDLTGPYGITFLILTSNVIVFQILQRRQRHARVLGWVIGLSVLIAAPLLYGLIREKTYRTSDEEIKIVLIQGNIDPYQKWTPGFMDTSMQTYHNLSCETLSLQPDLIIWPESAVPNYIRYRYHYRNQVKSLIDSMGVPVLTGASDYDVNTDGKTEKYNAAFLIKPKRWAMDRYIKCRLVPFSERVPCMDKMPFLYRISSRVSADVGDYTPGDSCVVFQFQPKELQHPVRFSTLICFDSVFPMFVRQFVQDGARFLSIITNDGWFGNTSGPYQHLQYAVLRAIENRVWVARCANTGISCFIDPLGKTIRRTRFDTKDTLSATITLNNKKTIFTKYPYIFPWFIFSSQLLLILFLLINPLKER